MEVSENGESLSIPPFASNELQQRKEDKSDKYLPIRCDFYTPHFPLTQLTNISVSHSNV